MNNFNNIEIDDVIIVKKEKDMLFRDLIKNLDEDGGFEFNFDNMIIIGLDSQDNTYLLDEDDNILSEYTSEIDFDNIVAEGLDVECALETLDRKIGDCLLWVDRPESDMEESSDDYLSDVWYEDMGICVGVSDLSLSLK